MRERDPLILQPTPSVPGFEEKQNVENRARFHKKCMENDLVYRSAERQRMMFSFRNRNPYGETADLKKSEKRLPSAQTQTPNAGCFPSGCCTLPTVSCHPQVACLQESDAADPEECVPCPESWLSRCQWCRTPEFGGIKKGFKLKVSLCWCPK